MITLLALPRKALTLPRDVVNATQAAGLRYEARVSAWLEGEYNFHPQVEFERRATWHGRASRFRPDGLLFDAQFGRCCVVEIKTQENEQAYRQLREYQEWVGEWYGRPVRGLLITASCRPGSIQQIPHIEWVLGDHPFSLMVLAAGTRGLPRMNENGAKRGLGMGAGTPDTAIRSGGCVGDGAAGILRNPNVVAAA